MGAPREAYDREVAFAAAQLRLVPHNESVWEALRSLAAPPWPAQAGGAAGLGPPPHALAADPRYLELCREVLGGAPGCAPALSMLADVLLEQAALLEEAAAAAAAAGESSDDGGGEAPAGAEGQAAAASAAVARRLARQVLQRQLVADPIKGPYLRLELAALSAC